MLFTVKISDKITTSSLVIMFSLGFFMLIKQLNKWRKIEL